ncbi:hypothetical protein A8709_05265 [Paenibacillus pectinilyticus]|uniref:DNA-binding response regulator n=1 Tax=Paenibacillus pectinilyticus TaxID=512399 RepID=A0A1C0ZSP6_9BACL|nr:response regulator [Paenibacillus pectinilyticus]OCT11102.1 hypothetical protein A8709_05265 [Paenibacillus pectinilyticus]
MYPVMIVEDEVWIRNALIEMIERSDLPFFVAGEAEDGEDAYTKICEIWPMVLITDIQMPKLDGLSLIKRLHDAYVPIVPIVVSGYDEFAYAQQAIRYQVSEYLLKPVEEKALLEALERSLDRMANMKELHKPLGEFEAFLQGLHEGEPQRHFRELQSLIRSVLGFKGKKPAVRRGLLRLFDGQLRRLVEAGSLSQDKKDTQSQLHILESEDETGIQRHFASYVEAWFRMREQSAEHRMPYLVHLMKQCIHERYMDEISLQLAAEQAEISVAYASTLFKQHTGEPFITYLNRYRVEKSKELLLNPLLKVYQVADQTGFASIHYFNRVFKTFTGQTPLEFRKELGL